MDNLNVLTCRLLGATFARKGEIDLAIDAYSLCSNYILKNKLLNYQRKVFKALAELHYKNNLLDKTFEYYHLYDKANNAFTERKTARQLTEYKIIYQAQEKEQADQLLKAESDLKKCTIRFYILLGIMVLVFALVIAGWFLMRRRSFRLKQRTDRKIQELDSQQKEENLRRIHEQEELLRRILADRQELNKKNEELRTEIERSDATNALQNVLQKKLIPRLFTNEEEKDFRRQFITIHPGFLFNLRELCPTVTRAEELLAMLMRLNLTSEEISLILGTNRSTVNASRSRLRKKLKLEDGDSLEDLIKEM